jgi:hypothetical protein
LKSDPNTLQLVAIRIKPLLQYTERKGEVAIIAVLAVSERWKGLEPMPRTAKKSDLVYLILFQGEVNYYIIKIANDKLKFVSFDKKPRLIITKFKWFKYQ